MAEMKTITLDELKGLVQARVTDGESLRKVAPTLGASAATLSRLLLHAHVRPGPKLLRVLGYQPVTMYRKVKP